MCPIGVPLEYGLSVLGGNDSGIDFAWQPALPLAPARYKQAVGVTETIYC
jgi:hypothetical protein